MSETLLIIKKHLEFVDKRSRYKEEVVARPKNIRRLLTMRNLNYFFNIKISPFTLINVVTVMSVAIFSRIFYAGKILVILLRTVYDLRVK